LIERDSYESFARAIHPGDIVYDVGAHIGTLLTFRLIGVNYEIHLFAEPSTNEELGAAAMQAGKRGIS
jgi:hypothetical protein